MVSGFLRQLCASPLTPCPPAWTMDINMVSSCSTNHRNPSRTFNPENEPFFVSDISQFRVRVIVWLGILLGTGPAQTPDCYIPPCPRCPPSHQHTVPWPCRPRIMKGSSSDNATVGGETALALAGSHRVGQASGGSEPEDWPYLSTKCSLVPHSCFPTRHRCRFSSSASLC